LLGFLRIEKEETMIDILKKNREKADKYNQEFKRIFGESLMNYFSFFFGFDVIKFDEKFIKPNEGESTNQAVERKFGRNAVELCLKLMA
jgi:hypothetical protein